eukprot:m.78154 g.78154  ORF g.78154 m.78154 type:complete len:362 (-) comp8564_c0_seq1:1624-2709(-)
MSGEKSQSSFVLKHRREENSLHMGDSNGINCANSEKNSRRSTSASSSKQQFPQKTGPLPPESSSSMLFLQLLGIAIVWYTASFFTDTFNKKVQGIIQIPITLTFCQFFIGGIMSSIPLRVFNVWYFKPLRKDEMSKLIPIALCWCAGFVLTNMSLGNTDVSFTHSVKATEPVWLVAIATFFFAQSYSWKIWLSLIPIVGGIIMIATTELHFSILGFALSASSTCFFVLRSIFAKRIFASKLVDNVNLFYYMSWMAAIFTFPLALIFEGDKLLTLLDVMPAEGWMYLALNGLLHYTYCQSAMTYLTKATALTYTITNTFRRFVVIVFAIILFGKQVTQSNVIGMGVLMVGVFSYAYLKAQES